MKNFLTITAANTGTAAQRTAPITGASPAQTRVRQTLGSLVQAYNALSMTQKSGWQSVANTLNSQQDRAGRSKMTPANAFVTLNSARLACGCPINSDAPADLTAPPILPPVTLDTHNISGVFSLKLASSSYPCALCLWAAPPTSVGKNTFPDNSFKAIGSLGVLVSGSANDITDLYTAAFGTPEAGSQIALKLIATSPAGIRLSPLLLTGIVNASAGDKPRGK